MIKQKKPDEWFDKVLDLAKVGWRQPRWKKIVFCPVYFLKVNFILLEEELRLLREKLRKFHDRKTKTPRAD